MIDFSKFVTNTSVNWDHSKITPNLAQMVEAAQRSIVTSPETTSTQQLCVAAELINKDNGHNPNDV